jgi:hypothetical protein
VLVDENTSNPGRRLIPGAYRLVAPGAGDGARQSVRFWIVRA